MLLSWRLGLLVKSKSRGVESRKQNELVPDLFGLFILFGMVGSV
jgi:hypothetical protein